MSESERIACKACGKWMFHLAKTCPHCGAAQVPTAAAAAATPGSAAKPELKLSADEARALLVATSPNEGERRTSFTEVAEEMIMPRGGTGELVLSILAGPVTVITVLELGYLLLREKQHQREDKLQGVRLLAVPACTLMTAALLYGSPVPFAGWALLGTSFLAWAGREALRRSAARPPML